MDGMHSVMFPGLPDKNRSYKPSWLTSASYEFPRCAMLNPSLSDRITHILYYARVMDQKKVLCDFYKLCKNNFGNKSQSISLESSINAWIKNSIVKLHRRREVIISENVSTLQARFIFEISNVVFKVFNDYLVDSCEKGQISCVNASPKRQECNTNWDILFPKNEMLLNATCLNSSPFLCQKENNKMIISMGNPWQCLRNFWLEFCYHPDPTQYIKSIHLDEESETTGLGIIVFQNNQSAYNKDSTQVASSDDSKTTNSIIIWQNNHCMKNLNLTQHSSDSPERRNSTQQSTDVRETTNSSIILQNSPIMGNTNSPHHFTDSPEANSSYCIMDNTNSAQHSDEDQSILSSESDSDSSGSWSCNDFNDDSISEDNHLLSYTSNNKFLEKCNATIEWLQSTACSFDSDDDTVNFGDALTEDNCLGSPSSKGSLSFVDCSDEEDEYEVLFLNGSSDTGFESDAFMDMSQGFENPCFEDSFRVFPVPSFIEMVNECWKEDMMELQDKPRKPSKVSFAPEPSLVTVQYFEKTEENTFDASFVLDNLRFRQRINELGLILSPFLTIEHRMVVQKSYCFYEE